MPLVDLTRIPGGRLGIPEGYRATPLEEPEPDVERPPLGETIGAAFRTDNTIGSLVSSESVWTPDDIVPGFSPYETVKGTKFAAPEYEDLISEARSPKMLRAIQADIEREEEARKVLEASGVAGMVASVGAAAADWPTLLPGGAFVRSAKGGFDALRSAGAVGAAAAVSTAAQESVLQATQQTRTATETGFAIGGGALLGGLLGGAAAPILGRAEWASHVKRLEKDLYDNAPLDVDLREAEMQEYLASAPAPGGADITARDTLDDLSISRESGMGGAAAATAGALPDLNPMLRGAHSPAVAVRRLMQGMIETPIYMKKNFDDRASEASVETLKKEFTQGAVGVATERQNQLYKSARKTGFDGTRYDFRVRVGRALRRGDVDLDGEENVTAAAQEWRRRVFDPLKDRAIEVGLLPPDVSVETATSYFMRMFNRPKIEANEPKFRQVVRDWAKKEAPKALAAERRKMQRQVDSLYREKEELELGRLRRQSRETELRRSETEFGSRETEFGQQVDLDGFTEESLLDAVRLVRGGGRPKDPESLISWLGKQGGLYDDAGELAAMGITGRVRPGFVRARRRAVGAPAKEGGLSFDDAAHAAWEEGFFRGGDRPSIPEFLAALDDEWRGLRRVVRAADDEIADRARAFDDVAAALDRMGVDVKAPRFGTSEDIAKLAANLNKAIDDQAAAKVAEIEAKIAELTRESRLDQEMRFDLDQEFEGYVEDIVTSIFNKITGREGIEESPHHITVAARGPLKERTFNIPDELIEDFLESDVQVVADRYARIMSADVELARKYGDPTLKAQIQEVVTEYETLRARVDADLEMAPAVKERQLARLRHQERRDINDIKATRDMLRGVYMAEQNQTNYARILNVANMFNYLRILGGVTPSSFTDVARPLMVHGLGRYMRDGLKPLILNHKAFKMSVQEGRLGGSVAERILNTRMATLAEVVDPYSVSSPFERFMQNSATMFSKLNALVFWNDFMKSFASVITQNRLIGNAMSDWGQLSRMERAYMNFLGIDEGMADRIARQVKAAADAAPEQAGQMKGVWVAGTELWDDEVARRTFRAALNKDVDSIITTKGIGDVPLFAHTPTGRSLLQFKSFALASHQRALLRGMQESKLGFLNGMIGATTVGMLIYHFKQIESGRDVSDNPGTWIAEGLDRSGLFSIAFEASNTWEKAGGYGVHRALQSAFPDRSQQEGASRYAVRNVTSSMLGPTAGLIEDVVKLFAAANNGDLKPGDINAIRRLIPGATLPMIRSVLEYEVLPAAKDAVR